MQTHIHSPKTPSQSQVCGKPEGPPYVDNQFPASSILQIEPQRLAPAQRTEVYFLLLKYIKYIYTIIKALLL